MTREERIARIQRIERIKEAEAAQGENEAQPVTPEEQGLGSKILEGGLKALDYTRGITGGPLVAKALGVEKPGEFEKAATFDAPYPNTAELLKRAEILTDGSPRSGMYREAFGLVGDIATDPLTYLSLGTNLAAKGGGKIVQALNKALNPTAKLAEVAGKNTWKSAFKALDQEALKQGASVMPSKVLMDAGVAAPTAKGVREKMAQEAERLFDAREAVLADATKRGATVDPDTLVKPLEDLAAQYRALGIEEGHAAADALESQIKTLKRDMGPKVDMVTKQVIEPAASPIRATKVKTFFSDKVPQGARMEFSPQMAKEEKAIAAGSKEAVEESITDTLGRAVGDEFSQTNANLGALLNSRKKQLGEVGKESMKNAITSIDAPLAAGIKLGEVPWQVLAAKKAADFFNMQGPRSMLGKSFNVYGKSPAASVGDSALRRSVWNLMSDEEKNKLLREEPAQ